MRQSRPRGMWSGTPPSTSPMRSKCRQRTTLVEPQSLTPTLATPGRTVSTASGQEPTLGTPVPSGHAHSTAWCGIKIQFQVLRGRGLAIRCCFRLCCLPQVMPWAGVDLGLESGTQSDLTSGELWLEPIKTTANGLPPAPVEHQGLLR